VNNALKNYVTSEVYFEELGFIPISKDFLRKVFSRLAEPQLKAFGKEMGLIMA
jgi:hypothetical protein